jgi:tRNA dimethylallyltransferase
MDSAMVFRGMDIGTAKPAIDVRKRIAHHLVDIRDPEEAYSAGRFAADALPLIEAINARGRLPLIVGGTLLYLKALREGIAHLPERDAATRSAIDARAAAAGWPAMHAELARIDPETAGRIEPTDRQRIQRALEVQTLTGRTLSELHRSAQGREFEFPVVALIPQDRAALADSIAARFDAMLDAGLVDEVRGLRARPGLTADSASMRAVGYRQLWAWLDRKLELAEARQRAIIATRQLAKRQLTGLRSDRKSEKLPADDAANLKRLRERVQIAIDSA